MSSIDGTQSKRLDSVVNKAFSFVKKNRVALLTALGITAMGSLGYLAWKVMRNFPSVSKKFQNPIWRVKLMKEFENSERKKRVLVVSDVHCGDNVFYKTHDTHKHIITFLKNEVLQKVNEIDALVFLGDIIDMWLQDSSVAPKTFGELKNSSKQIQEFTNVVRSIGATKKILLFYVRGNHDDIITQEDVNILFGTSTAIQLCDTISIGNVLFDHGHAIDPFNRPLVRMKKVKDDDDKEMEKKEVLPPLGYYISRFFQYKKKYESSGKFDKRLKNKMESEGGKVLIDLCFRKMDLNCEDNSLKITGRSKESTRLLCDLKKDYNDFLKDWKGGFKALQHFFDGDYVKLMEDCRIYQIKEDLLNKENILVHGHCHKVQCHTFTRTFTNDNEDKPIDVTAKFFSRMRQHFVNVGSFVNALPPFFTFGELIYDEHNVCENVFVKDFSSEYSVGMTDKLEVFEPRVEKEIEETFRIVDPGILYPYWSSEKFL